MAALPEAGAAGALADAVDDELLDEAPVPVSWEEEPLDGAALPVAPVPLLRKSVTYQPEPFNWKPAAVTCLT